MAITRQQVDHIAELAKLSLSDAEKARLQEQLSDILAYAQQLQALNTDAISPTASVLPLRSVWRDDVVTPSTPTSALLANAPKATGDSFEVQAVLE